MGDKSEIQWTEATWNPLSGCNKISDGCKNCYAIKDAHRLAGNPNPKIAAKYEGTTKIENGKMNWTGKINLASEDVLTQPLRWTRPRKIFVNSMSDLFHKDVPDEWINKIFAVMALCPQHTFQILTKRAERMHDYLKFREVDNAKNFNTRVNPFVGKFLQDTIADTKTLHRELGKYECSWKFPLPNVHLGVSVENQEQADKRIPLLLETPAAVRWLSCEPLLGKVDLFSFLYTRKEMELMQFHPQKIDWVVVGGESGHNARPCDIAWIRSIVQQCKSANVPVFVKQLGKGRLEYGKIHVQPDSTIKNQQSAAFTFKNSKGGDISEFPKDLQIRELPNEASRGTL